MPAVFQIHIRHWRQAHHLTRRQLAEAVGVNYTTLKRLEAGTAPLTPERQAVLARYFQLAPWELITFSEWGDYPCCQHAATPAATDEVQP